MPWPERERAGARSSPRDWCRSPRARAGRRVLPAGRCQATEVEWATAACRRRPAAARPGWQRAPGRSRSAPPPWRWSQRRAAGVALPPLKFAQQGLAHGLAAPAIRFSGSSGTSAVKGPSSSSRSRASSSQSSSQTSSAGNVGFTSCRLVETSQGRDRHARRNGADQNLKGRGRILVDVPEHRAAPRAASDR